MLNWLLLHFVLHVSIMSEPSKQDLLDAIKDVQANLAIMASTIDARNFADTGTSSAIPVKSDIVDPSLDLYGSNHSTTQSPKATVDAKSAQSSSTTTSRIILTTYPNQSVRLYCISKRCLSYVVNQQDSLCSFIVNRASTNTSYARVSIPCRWYGVMPIL